MIPADAARFVGSSLSALEIGGATSLSVAPELAAFALGKKQALRITGGESHCMRFIDAARAAGSFAVMREAWAIRRTPTFSELVAEPRVGNGETCWVVACAHEASYAEELLEAELSDCVRAGQLLGYPACCVRAVEQQDEAGPDGWVRLLVEQASDDNLPCWANCLASEWGGGVPSGELYPCSLNCEGAIGLGRVGVDSLSRLGLTRLANLIVDHACTPLWFDEKSRTVSRAAAEGCGRWLRFEA